MKKFKFDTRSCMLATAVLLGLTYLVFTVQYETNDDPGMMQFLSGYATKTPEIMPYAMGTLYSFFISRLYMLTAHIPWYICVHMVLNTTAVLTVCWVFVHGDKPDSARLLSYLAFLILFFSVYWYSTVDMEFTTVPGFCGAAAVLLCVDVLSDKTQRPGPKRIRIALMCVFFLFGYNIREQGGIVTLAVLLYTAAACVLLLRAPWKTGAVCAALVLAAAAGSRLVNDAYIQATDWKDWMEYGATRNSWIDLYKLPYEGNEDIYANVGWGKEEFDLASHWCFLDDKCTLETFAYLTGQYKAAAGEGGDASYDAGEAARQSRQKSSAPQTGTAAAEPPAGGVLAKAKSILAFGIKKLANGVRNEGLFYLPRILFNMLGGAPGVILTLVTLVLGGGAFWNIGKAAPAVRQAALKRLIVAAGYYCGMLAGTGYLAYMGRQIDRARLLVLMLTAAPAVCILASQCRPANGKKVLLGCMAAVSVFAAVSGGGKIADRTIWQYEYSRELYRYGAEHPEDLYVLDNSNIDPADPWLTFTLGEESNCNCVFWGGFLAKSPMYDRMLANSGCENLNLVDMLEENRYFVGAAGSEMAGRDMLAAYYNKKFDDVEYRLEEETDRFVVYCFRHTGQDKSE